MSRILIVTRKEADRNETFKRQADRLADKLKIDLHEVTVTADVASTDLRNYDRVIVTWWRAVIGVDFPAGIFVEVHLYDHLSWARTPQFVPIARRADLVCCSNPILLEEARAYGLKRLALHPDSVDQQHFMPMPTGKDGVLKVGWVGDSREDWIKNWPLVQQLQRSLKNRGVELRIADSGDPSTFIPYSEMPSWYNGLDLLLVTSRYEGTPNPLLEALSCGIPAWSTPVGLAPAIASKYPRAVKLLEQEPSANTLVEMLTNTSRVSLLPGARVAREAAAAYAAPATAAPAPRVSGGKPRVAMIIDNPDWAFARIAQQIQQHLGHKFEFGLHCYPQLHPGDLDHYDLIYAFGYHPMADIKRVLHPASKTPIVSSVYDHILWQQSPQCKAVLDAAVAGSVSLVCCNARIADDLRNEYPGKTIYVCPDGVDLEMFKPEAHKRTGKIGWCGNTQFHRDIKGVDLIRASVPEESLKLADANIRKMPHSEMPEWYHTLDYYICGSTAEGTPNPLLEALASGIPVMIDPRVGLAPDLVPSPAIIELPEDRTAESWRPVIEAALKAKNYKARSKAARALVAPYSWHLMVANYERAFTQELEAAQCK